MEKHRLITVQLTEQSDGADNCYLGTFAFELEGIITSNSGERGSSMAKDELRGSAFESLVEGLTPQQRIIFSFARVSNRARLPQFIWRVRGEARADSKGDARKAANALWKSVFLMLAAQTEYRFRPLPGPLPYNEFPHHHSIYPRAANIRCSSAGKPIGFTTSENVTQHPELLLPLLDLDPSTYLPLVTILSAWSLDIEIEVVLDTIPLTSPIRGAIKHLATTEAPGEISARYLADGSEMEGSILRGAMDTWRAMLNYCLAHHKAVVVEVNVGSMFPLPPAILATIGRALFPNLSFEPNLNTPGDHEDSESTAVDLRMLVSTDRNLLRSLLPSINAIKELDLPKSYSPPPNNLPREGILLGKNLGQEIYLSEKDRKRHTYIMGATGTGKSTLIFNMVMQDIQSGKGVCLIDPHGDLYTEVLRNIPEQRWKKGDVVLFDPLDFEHPAGINFMECSSPYPEVEKSILINEFIEILDILYDLRQTGGPIFEQYMRNALLLLLHNSEEVFTLVDVPAVFEDERFRNHLKRTCTNSIVVSFWENQAEQARHEASLKEMAPYITSKLNQFSHNPVLRPILGQSRSTIDFRQLMDEQKILLINLSKGILSKRDSYLLGMLIISKLFRAALSRVNIAQGNRKIWHVYIDEFQNFMTDTMSEILGEARKFGLALTLANQHMAQLHDHTSKNNIMSAVLGNVSNLLFFRLGTEDASRIDKYMSPYLNAEDLQFLPDYHIAARILSNLSPTKPFVFKTHPKPEDAPHDPSDEIRRMSIERYGRDRDIVEKEILARRNL